MTTQNNTVLFDPETGTVLDYDPSTLLVVDLDELADITGHDDVNSELCEGDRYITEEAEMIGTPLNKLLR